MAVFSNSTTGKLSVGGATPLAPNGTIDTIGKSSHIVAAVKAAWDAGKMTLVSGIPFFDGVMPEFVKKTAAEWTADDTTVLGNHVFGLETDTGKVKIGDGVKKWAALSYHTVTNTTDGTAVYEVTQESILEALLAMSVNSTTAADLADLIGTQPEGADDLYTEIDTIKTSIGTLPEGVTDIASTIGVVQASFADSELTGTAKVFQFFDTDGTTPYYIKAYPTKA